MPRERTLPGRLRRVPRRVPTVRGSTDGTGLGETLAEPPDGEPEGLSPAAGEPPLHPLSSASEADHRHDG